MESEHTPGPWHAYNRGIGWEVHEGASCREGFCLCGPVNSGPKDTFSEADARLIAVAPELLECLKDVVETFLGYAAIHFNKHTPEGDQKAEWNARQAAKYWAVVQKARGWRTE